MIHIQLAATETVGIANFTNQLVAFASIVMAIVSASNLWFVLNSSHNQKKENRLYEKKKGRRDWYNSMNLISITQIMSDESSQFVDTIKDYENGRINTRQFIEEGKKLEAKLLEYKQKLLFLVDCLNSEKLQCIQQYMNETQDEIIGLIEVLVGKKELSEKIDVQIFAGKIRVISKRIITESFTLFEY